MNLTTLILGLFLLFLGLAWVGAVGVSQEVLGWLALVAGILVLASQFVGLDGRRV